MKGERCESCIDRIFSLGPSPCPVFTCGQILRKAHFTIQSFEDLGVQKEVVIRQRIAKWLVPPPLLSLLSSRPFFLVEGKNGD